MQAVSCEEYIALGYPSFQQRSVAGVNDETEMRKEPVAQHLVSLLFPSSEVQESLANSP